MASSSAGLVFRFAKGPTRPTTCVWTRSMANSHSTQKSFSFNNFFFHFISILVFGFVVFFSYPKLTRLVKQCRFCPVIGRSETENGNRGFKFEEVKFENKSAFQFCCFFFFCCFVSCVSGQQTMTTVAQTPNRNIT